MNPIKPSTETPVPTVSLGLSAYSPGLLPLLGSSVPGPVSTV